MSKVVLALVVATIVCGSASAYLWRELQAERTQTQTLRARVAAFEQTVTDARAAVAEQQRIATRPVEEPPPSANVKQSTPASAPAAMLASSAPAAGVVTFGAMRGPRMDPETQRRMQEGFEQQRRMLQDPEYRELMRAQHKQSMTQMYGDLEEMMGLSREEADRLLDVLAEQQVRSMEQARPMFASGDGTPPDENVIREQQRAFAEIKRKNDQELQSVLGSRFSEWEEYQRNMGARSQVTRLRQTLAISAEPLRQDQIKPLVEAMSREHQQQSQMGRWAKYPSGPVSQEDQLRMQEEWLERTAQTHQRIRDAVSSLLSPAQLQRLQEQQDQERKMQELQLRMQRARAQEAAARGEDPANRSSIGFAPMTVIH